MTSASRHTALVWVAGGLVGLLAIERLLLAPAAHAWAAQSRRIAELRERVAQGRMSADRIDTVRARWADALDRSLPADAAAGEEQVIKAVGEWARESRVALTALTPRWRKESDGFQVLECRVTAQGDWLGLARLLDAIENGRPAIRLDQFDLTPREDRGTRLTMSVRFSALQIPATDREPRP